MLSASVARSSHSAASGSWEWPDAMAGRGDAGEWLVYELRKQE
jgi:hypothetical protein